MKQRCLVILLVLLSLLAIFYPLISSRVNEKYRSEVRTAYYESIASLDNGALETERRLASAYNELLFHGVQEAYSDPQRNKAAAEYLALLNLNADGVMGYVEIPKLDIHLPIYHGTDAETLEKGAGHVIGSSLPVGGPGTHAVISAHSGMAREKMFSDLGQLAKGDVFFLHTLGETLAYEVESSRIVLPSETEPLRMEAGADLVTLVTCTPFGVNSHRLLVRGHRTEFTQEEAAQKELPTPMSSTWEQEYKKGLLWGLCALFVIVILYVVFTQDGTPTAAQAESGPDGVSLDSILKCLREL